MRLFKRLAFVMSAILFALTSMAQVTGGAITGSVKDSKGITLAGASIEVLHEPSGTKYKSVSAASGRFNVRSGVRAVLGPATPSLSATSK